MLAILLLVIPLLSACSKHDLKHSDKHRIIVGSVAAEEIVIGQSVLFVSYPIENRPAEFRYGYKIKLIKPLNWQQVRLIRKFSRHHQKGLHDPLIYFKVSKQKPAGTSFDIYGSLYGIGSDPVGRSFRRFNPGPKYFLRLPSQAND